MESPEEKAELHGGTCQIKNEQGLVNIKDLLLLPDSHLELLPNNLHMEYNNDFFQKESQYFLDIIGERVKQIF